MCVMHTPGVISWFTHRKTSRDDMLQLRVTLVYIYTYIFVLFNPKFFELIKLELIITQVRDQSTSENDDGLLISIFGKQDELPQIKKQGDIIRVHRACFNVYKGLYS